MRGHFARADENVRKVQVLVCFDEAQHAFIGYRLALLDDTENYSMATFESALASKVKVLINKVLEIESVAGIVLQDLRKGLTGDATLPPWVAN